MLICEKLFDKTFEGKNQKEAYLTCCKWIASNIIAVNNCTHITYSVEKMGGMFGKVKLTVYIKAEEEEILNRNCEICKEASDLFYIKGNRYKCESCKIPSFRRREQLTLDGIKEGLKGRIRKC